MTTREQQDLTAAGLIGWGGLHVVGGVALIAESRQGAGGALAVLGSAVALPRNRHPPATPRA